MGRYQSKKGGQRKLYGAVTRKGLRSVKQTKYLDQIYEDIQNPEKANPKEGDVDMPGFGRHYCIPCARYFISEDTLTKHESTKPHKRRVKALKKEEPYTGPTVLIDNGLRKPAVQTVTIDDPLSIPSNATRSDLDSSFIDAIDQL